MSAVFTSFGLMLLGSGDFGTLGKASKWNISIKRKSNNERNCKLGMICFIQAHAVVQVLLMNISKVKFCLMTVNRTVDSNH